MDWLDANLVPLLFGVPLISAFFASLVPGEDKVTLRHIGLGASVLTGIVALRIALVVTANEAGLHDIVFVPGLAVSFPVYLDHSALAPLLCVAATAPMALRGGAPRSVRFMKAHVLLILFLEALLFGVLTIEHALAAFTFLAASTYPILILHSLFGTQHKGSSGYRIAVVLTVADALTLLGIGVLYVPAGTGASAWMQDALGLEIANALLFALLLASAAVRVGLFPFTDWWAVFLKEAPVTVSALFAGALLPVSIFFAVRWGVLVMPETAQSATVWIAAITLATAATAVLHAWVEADIRRYWAFAVQSAGAIVFLGATTGRAETVALAVAGAASAGMSAVALCFIIDAIDRRFFTTESKELFGLAEMLPGLWRGLVFAGAALSAVPLMGFGLIFFPLMYSFVGRVEVAGVPGTAWVFVGVAFAAVQGGIALAFLLHAKQMLHLPEHQVRAPVPLTAGQRTRLLIPVLFALLGSVFVYVTAPTAPLLQTLPQAAPPGPPAAETAPAANGEVTP